MTGLSSSKRFEYIQKELNRIMERLQEISTIETAVHWTDRWDNEISELQVHVTALEQAVTSIENQIGTYNL